MRHLNGFHTLTDNYLADIALAEYSTLFDTLLDDSTLVGFVVFLTLYLKLDVAAVSCISLIVVPAVKVWHGLAVLVCAVSEKSAEHSCYENNGNYDNYYDYSRKYGDYQ